MLTVQNKEGVTLAFLNNLLEAKIHEVINGEYILTFTATVDPLKTPVLYDENNIIVCDNDYFRVRVIEEIHSEDDEVTVSIECEHVSYELIDNIMPNFSYSHKTAAEVITQCLLGTDYNLRYCTVTTKTDINYTQECNSKEILVSIANDWKGELKFFKNYVDLLPRRGTNRGTGFIFGKSLKSIKRTIDRATKTTSYEVDVVEGTEIDELGYYELGDTVRVMDERLNIDYECRIVKLEKDLLTGLNSKVVLGDAIKDMRSSFSNVRKDVQKVKETIEDRADDWDRIKDITDNSGNIVLGKLNNLTQIASKIVNSTGTFVQGDSFMMWHDQPTEDASTFATKWSAQGLVFANNKDANGDWVWQTALGADGLIATDVSASCLNAITANIITLVVDSLTGKTIKGCTFLGGEIWIGTNVPDDGNTSNYTGMVITKKGVINGYINGNLSYTLSHNSEGRLILRDEDKSLYMDSANTRIYSTGADLELMGGIPAYDVNNTPLNSRIILEENNGDIYLVANRGLGTVYVTGDLVVSGTIDN